jgi:hypothetical protein
MPDGTNVLSSDGAVIPVRLKLADVVSSASMASEVPPLCSDDKT